jgi:hypothetical protein
VLVNQVLPMSDDIPVIFAQPVVKPPPVVIFLSATHATQLEQYVVAGWQVFYGQSFTGCVIPAELAVIEFDPAVLEAAPQLIVGDIATLSDDWRHVVTLFTPHAVKINAAFSEDAAVVTSAAAFLSQQGYTLCALPLA